MARRPLSGDVFKITDEVGKTYEGSYAGKRQVDTGNKNPDQTPRLSTIHTLDTDHGPFSFWGFASVDNSLRRVKNGTYLWIEYTGMVKAKVGHAHTVKVEFDDETGGLASADTDDMPNDYPAKAFDPDDINPDLTVNKRQEIPV